MSLHWLWIYAFILTIQSGNVSPQERQPDDAIHPVLAGWWRGLNADGKTKHDLECFVESLLRDPYLHDDHEAFAISGCHSDTLLFAVPIAFFAYAKGYDAQRFVKAAQYASSYGEKPARAYSLALRIFMAGTFPVYQTTLKAEKDLGMKTQLAQVLGDLRGLSNQTGSIHHRFKAYNLLFAKFAKSKIGKGNKSQRMRAANQLVSVFENFPLVPTQPSPVCDDSSPNNVIRALLFALYNSQFPEGSAIDDTCKFSPMHYPVWLRGLSETLHGDVGFGKALLIDDALAKMKVSVEE